MYTARVCVASDDDLTTLLDALDIATRDALKDRRRDDRRALRRIRDQISEQTANGASEEVMR